MSTASFAPCHGVTLLKKSCTVSCRLTFYSTITSWIFSSRSSLQFGSDICGGAVFCCANRKKGALLCRRLCSYTNGTKPLPSSAPLSMLAMNCTVLSRCSIKLSMSLRDHRRERVRVGPISGGYSQNINMNKS